MAKWVKPEEKKWDFSNEESLFNELLKEHGFSVLRIREYNSKTDYEIVKDGIKVEYVFHHCVVGKENTKSQFKQFVKYYELSKEYDNMVKNRKE